MVKSTAAPLHGWAGRLWVYTCKKGEDCGVVWSGMLSSVVMVMRCNQCCFMAFLEAMKSCNSIMPRNIMYIFCVLKYINVFFSYFPGKNEFHTTHS